MKAMSEGAVKLVKGHEEYYVMVCSMSVCRAGCSQCEMDKFGEWVQSDPIVGNPFMGSASPHCGGIE